MSICYSKDKSQYDNNSTTIIIHDKDIDTENLHISVYKKRKDRSAVNKPIEDTQHKFSARNRKDNKSLERLSNQIDLDKLMKNAPHQKAYESDANNQSKRKRARTKKHHTGSEILLKDPTTKLPQERNVSMDITKHKSITDLYKGPIKKSIHLKKKSLQYAMKRSRINDLLK
jgi:hypothetical protein